MNISQNQLISYFTGGLHFAFALSIYFTTIFSFDLTKLFIMFVVVSIIIMLNKFRKNFRLWKIDENKLNISLLNKIYSWFPINYNENRRYEVNQQFAFIMWTILFTKIIFGTFQKELKNMLTLLTQTKI